MALMVVALPLSSSKSPILPNPVRPNFSVVEPDLKPAYDVNGETRLLESYGLTDAYFEQFARKPVIKYPNSDGHYDVLYRAIAREFTAKNVEPITENVPAQAVIFSNTRLGRTVRSSTMRTSCIRRTKFYIAGPSLHLPPSQWTVREVWASGGLVTFSPTFILRSPDKFAEIMKMISCTTNWAAYIIPQVTLWAEASWRETA